MAKFSACKPLFRAYADNALSTTTFKTNYHQLGKLVKITATPQFKEGNIYGDDGLAENKKILNYYDISLETTDFPVTALEDVLGLTKTTATSINTYSVKEDTESNYGIFGHIYGKVVDGVNAYVVEIYNRVKFDLPSNEFSTAGENIEFASNTLTGKAYVDSTGVAHKSTEYSTLSAAITALETAIGGTLATASAGGGSQQVGGGDG